MGDPWAEREVRLPALQWGEQGCQARLGKGAENRTRGAYVTYMYDLVRHLRAHITLVLLGVDCLGAGLDVGFFAAFLLGFPTTFVFGDHNQ